MCCKSPETIRHTVINILLIINMYLAYLNHRTLEIWKVIMTTV